MTQKRKTHCKYGHEFTPGNTYTFPDGRRKCRICSRRNGKSYYANHLLRERKRSQDYRVNNREQAAARTRRYRQNNKEKVKDRGLRYLYGISLEEYKQLLEAQGRQCAVCRRIPNKENLHIDHDHSTGEVRGLLCRSCNMGIGFFQDSPDLLYQASLYLEKEKDANKLGD